MNIQTHGHRAVAADLNGETLRAVAGSMVSYDGDLQFKKAPLGNGEGIGGAIRRKVGGEKLEMMDITGNGRVYLAVDAAEVEVVNLQQDTMRVESSSLLCYTPGLTTAVSFAGAGGMVAGQGLFTTTVSGTGTLALLSSGGPLIGLEVDQYNPLVVDPQAFVASVGQLNSQFATDMSWRNLIGESSGEELSLRFTGTGTVYIQPAER